MQQDHTEKLPPELVHRIIGEFKYAHLRPLLRVSRRWREIAKDAPGCWATISESPCSRPDARAIIARLAQTRGRPFTLALRSSTDSERMAEIFPAITAQLSHVKVLNMHIHVAQAAGLLAALSRAAPMVESLTLHVALSDTCEIPAVIPADIFSGSAPNLRSLTLSNAALPPESLVPAFRGVEWLRCEFTINTVSMPDLFAYFPSMRTLFLDGTISLRDLAARRPDAWAQLHVFGFNAYDGARAVDCATALLPLAVIAHVEARYPAPADAPPVLAGFAGAGAVHLVAWHDADSTLSCTLQFSDSAHARTRQLRHATSWLARPGVAAALAAPGVAGRLASLAVGAALWDALARALPALPCVDTVRLLVARDWAPPAAALDVPALARLVLRADAPRALPLPLPLRAATAFARAGLRSARFPLRLGVENVRLGDESAGDAEEASAYFAACETLDPAGWDFPRAIALARARIPGEPSPPFASSASTTA